MANLQKICVFDFETDGADPDKCSPVQLAALMIDPIKLEIIEDPNSPRIAPRRYAIAKDRRGIIVLRGDSSFSSSTDVLLDEIKFRIDNQLP
jgi:hypothetical protein